MRGAETQQPLHTPIFNSAGESYQVANVSYVGPVREIPEEKRRGESTHSFRMYTPLGTVYCNYKSDETAKKSRSALAAMMGGCKPSLYKHGFELIDTQKIVSFSSVLQLKNAQNGHTHAIVVNVESGNTDNSQVWLRYRSEENAVKGRKALYAAIHAANRMLPGSEEQAPQVQTEPVGEAVKEGLPF
jgi:hypothetical protein